MVPVSISEYKLKSFIFIFSVLFGPKRIISVPIGKRREEESKTPLIFNPTAVMKGVTANQTSYHGRPVLPIGTVEMNLKQL